MKIGYAYVVADILHIGHILHLQNCKGLCDRLIVGVLTDEAAMEKKSKPILSFHERSLVVQSLKCVDATVPQYTYSPETNLAEIRPDILFECQTHDERQYPSFKGLIMAMPYYPMTSSTDIKQRINNA